MILGGFDPLSCSLKRVHASTNMFACPLFNELLSITACDLYWENKCKSEKGLFQPSLPKFEKHLSRIGKMAYQIQILRGIFKDPSLICYKKGKLPKGKRAYQ